MNSSFYMNGYLWKVIIVNPDDPMLRDRTNKQALATCDPTTNTVYMSSSLSGDMFYKVLIHELGHCVIFSYGIDIKLHQLVAPEHWIDAEEWLCNFIYDYGLKVFSSAERILGHKAIDILPQELEKLIS